MGGETGGLCTTVVTSVQQRGAHGGVCELRPLQGSQGARTFKEMKCGWKWPDPDGTPCRGGNKLVLMKRQNKDPPTTPPPLKKNISTTRSILDVQGTGSATKVFRRKRNGNSIPRHPIISAHMTVMVNIHKTSSGLITQLWLYILQRLWERTGPGNEPCDISNPKLKAQI